MTLLLSNEDAEDLLTMPDCIDALEQAYREVAEERAIMGARGEIVTQTTEADAVYQLKTMSATIASIGMGSVRINSDILSWPVVDGTRRRRKMPLAPGNRWTGLVILFSTESGEPLAIFPDGVVQRMRVAGASGLGVKYLARHDAETAALLGSGWQAGSQAMAVSAVRDIKTIRCFSPNAAHRDAFCRDMTSRLGIETVPADSAAMAARGADIVLCATNSMDHVFFRDALEPGMHVSTIRDGDLDPAIIKASDIVVMHDPASVDTGHYLTTHGLHIPDQDKDAASASDMTFLADVPILPDLIAGTAAGRAHDDQVTCFLNFRGLAVQFTAVGAALYRKARDAGRGRDLPSEWFTEDVHP